MFFFFLVGFIDHLKSMKKFTDLTIILKTLKCLQMYELIVIIVDLCTRFLQLEPC
jgi:hypothetical protein